MPRSLAIACALCLLGAVHASAQAPAAGPVGDGDPNGAAEPAADGGDSTAETEAPAPDAPPDAAVQPAGPAPVPQVAEAPKIAVVVLGDPDPALQAAARRVERAVGDSLRLPFDPGLRAALRGEPGERDDGLGEVRGDRRRLSAEEAHDAPLLASLGRRAGAGAVAVVRAGASAPELVMLDVRNAAFYEGALSLESDASDARIASFVTRRARASAATEGVDSAASAAASTTPAPAAAVAAAEPEQPAHQPDFFEQYWPYGAAALLLGVMITAIALTSSGGAGATQPVLRFVPGGM